MTRKVVDVLDKYMFTDLQIEWTIESGISIQHTYKQFYFFIEILNEDPTSFVVIINNNSTNNNLYLTEHVLEDLVIPINVFYMQCIGISDTCKISL